MKRFGALLAFVLVAPLCAQDYFRPDVVKCELDGALRTDWYGVYLKGKKIGYFTTTREKVEKGVRESFDMRLKLFSFGQKAEFKLSQWLVFDAEAPYAMREGQYVEDAGKIVSTFRFVRSAPKTYAVTQTVGDVKRTKTVDNVDYALGDSLGTEVWIRRGQKVGAEILVRDFEPKEQKIHGQSSKVLGSKTSIVSGVPVKYYEIESISKLNDVRIVSLHDDQGKLLSGNIAIFELRLETEAQAKNTEYSQDLFVLGQAKIDRPLGALNTVRELVLDAPGARDVFPDGPLQSIAEVDGRTLLRVGKVHGKRTPATKEEIAENLAETSTHHVKDPKVVALAAKAVGDAKTDLDKVKNLVRFTHRYVRPTFSNAIPTIHDLLENKKGDCKAYALLFTNLARASGLPAREMAGLLYVGDDQKAFGGHAWNEVVVDGHWIPIDAAFDEVEPNATHLCFGTEKRAARNLLETMGNLKLRVVSVNGK